MLYINTKLGPSQIHGLGLFAVAPIAAGDVIWKFTPGFDQAFTSAAVMKLPTQAQIHFATYGYRSKRTGLYILASDDGRFFNHSETPNTCTRYDDKEQEAVTYAARRIEASEELTENYSAFEEDDDPDNVLTQFFTLYGLSDEIDPRLKWQAA